MSIPAIQALDLGKSYGPETNRIEVLRALSLNVHPGELTLCVGPSGSGKSTLLSILSGLLRPETGSVTLLGENLWTLDEARRDRFRLEHCGFVFQGFNLFPGLTALENVLLPLRFLGISPAEARRRARDALAEVGLADRAHLQPSALSGGEKQRTAIARAITRSPRIIFADEPTSALDRHNGQIVIDILHRFARTHRTTVIGVTHDPRLITHADRVIHLEDGAIQRDERPSPSVSAHP